MGDSTDGGRLHVPLFTALVAIATTSSAAAQSFGERASALRPTGLASETVQWDSTLMESPRANGHYHRIVHDHELRVPVASVLLSVALTSSIRWEAIWPDDHVVLLATGPPEIGLAFTDWPAEGWRYELGGAITVPVAATDLVDGELPRSGLFPSPPPAYFRLREDARGWNAHRQRLDTLAVIAHARAEVDALEELVAAVEADVALHVPLDGEVDVYPQVAIELAGRFLEYQLVGIRAELTTYLPPGDYPEDFDVVVEPFVRLVLPSDHAGAFLRVAARLPLGPARPVASQYDDELWAYRWGVSLGLGALF